MLKDRFDLALDMLADLVQRPAYAEDEINRQRQQLLSGMRVSYDDPTYIASVVFGRLVYGEHPYGVPQNGTPASLQTITRSDLVDFHDVHYLPNNAILAIVGDVSAEEAFAGAERALGDWRRGPEPPAAAIELPPPAARLIVVDKPGAVQTTVWVGHRALPRGHPDFLTLDVAIKILGGEGGNRLGGVLRTQRSLTYSASAETAARRFGGDILAKTDTRSDATAEVLRLTVDEIARLRRDRVSDRELENAIAYLAGNFPLTIETPNAIASRVLEARLYGLDLDEIETYPERVRAVTPRDIQRVAREHLHPDRLAIVLVGDARVFVGDLAGVGFDEFEVVPLAEFRSRRAGLSPPVRLAPAR